MTIQNVESFIAGEWLPADDSARPIYSAINGDLIAHAGRALPNASAMLEYAKEFGGPSLRAMTFHDRARMLKALAVHLNEHKKKLYDISFSTGATQRDHYIDVDGGIGTLFVFASKGRREMPDGHIYLDGPVEQLSKNGTFQGQHICTSLKGVAVHINAFNFPVWGMLEKLAPTLLAGVPAIVKPATATCYVTELCVRLMMESGVLPKGALQLVTGGLGDALDHLDMQDVVSFTGSEQTALFLRATPNILQNSVRFVAEQDSLNASILGPDAVSGTPEFDLFIKEVISEMTTKAGQKCTAIRRIFVPNPHVDAVGAALREKLSQVVIGDPRLETTRMGALVSSLQKKDVLDKAGLIGSEAEILFGTDEIAVEGEGLNAGAFVSPMLFHCSDADAATHVHSTEAFGPISTLMGYRDLSHVVELVNRGGGSLVASLVTHDADVVEDVVMGAASHHGRIYINDRVSMKESTGHGSPLPHMVHGGPGRAGGGEELGGVRGVMHYMQRTAIQASPDMLKVIGKRWVAGAKQAAGDSHPFRRSFNELFIGETLTTDSRVVTLEDIEHFAHFTGDTFYAHMDEEAAKRNPFFPGRVAHGYLLLSFAAGLFVEPSEGPVLANTGLDNLRFTKPVIAGDALKVLITVKEKTRRNEEYGEVRWHVTLLNQNDDKVAEYELLTMNALEWPQAEGEANS